MTDILDLPPEVLQKIFKFLSLSDLLKTRIVCRSFRDAASSQQVLELDLEKRRFPVREFDQLELLDPLRGNVTSLNLFCNPGVTEEDQVDTYVTTEQFHKIRDGSNRLRRFKLFNYSIRDDISISVLPKTLTHLSLDCVKFDDSDRFFDVEECGRFRKMAELELMRCGHLQASAVEGISRFVNLVSLHLTEFLMTDKEFGRFDGHLNNLEELRVVGLDIGDESFEIIGRNFINLKRLTVTRCSRLRDEGFSALKNNHQLEELHVKGCHVTDHGASRVLGYLVNLKGVCFSECPIGDQTMKTIFRSRATELGKLQITLDGDTNITDASLDEVSSHKNLKDLYLQGVGLADEGIRKLAPCVPNLEKLYICSCNVRDEGIAAIAKYVTKLTDLILNDTLITDEGLIPIGQNLKKLIRIEIDSIEMSERGVRPVLDYLSTMKFVHVSFGTSGAGIHVNGIPPSRQVDIKGKDVSVEFVQDVLRAFHNSFTISFSQVELSPSIVENVSKSHKELMSIYIYDSYTDNDTTLAILRYFLDLTELHVYNSLVTDELLIEIAEKYGNRLEKLSIENENFIKSETIVRIVPLIASLKWCEICSVDYNSRLIYDNSSGDIKLNVAGNDITDEGIVAVVTAVPNLRTICMTATNVTYEGLERIVSKLNSLYRFEIVFREDDTAARGDEILKLIGSELPSQLKQLNINGGGVTDGGLLSLGDQLSNLQTIVLMNSNVTNEGLKTVASKLTSCNSMTVTLNQFITEDRPIIEYMALNHPQMRFVIGTAMLDLEDDEP